MGNENNPNSDRKAKINERRSSTDSQQHINQDDAPDNVKQDMMSLTKEAENLTENTMILPSAAEVGRECETFTNRIRNFQKKTKKLREKLKSCHLKLDENKRIKDQSRTAEGFKDSVLDPGASTSAGSGAGADSRQTIRSRSSAHTHHHEKRKTRRELWEIVNGLQSLLSKLTVQNKPLEMRVRRLAEGIPELQDFQLFSVDAEERPSTSRRVHRETDQSRRSMENSGHIRKSQRKDSESKATPPQSGPELKTKEVVEEDANNERTRTKKRKSKAVERTQASEQEALAKYINAIVAEQLDQLQQEGVEVQRFEGGYDDLEAYAQALVKAGLGRIVEEEIRINRKNNRQSFVALSADRESGERDGIIPLPVARRYAFEGDTVRAFVMNPRRVVNEAAATKSPTADTGNEETGKPRTEAAPNAGSFSVGDDNIAIDDADSSPDTDMEDVNELDTATIVISDNCPKAFVIAIVKQTELRQVVGTISFKYITKLTDDRSYFKFKPHDMRVPMMYIPLESCTEHMATHGQEDKDDICGMLYMAQVLETDMNGHCIGELIQAVGKVGNLEAEMKAILLQNGLRDIRPYEQRFDDLYNSPEPPVSVEELNKRIDLRSKCIFTIDPLTARDLDDAMSLEVMGSDEYEVGVHISDVSYYLHEDSELDNLVKERATSIYLVNEVIHMLPQSLCFRCSLLPGEDKFAFSVFWRMNGRGEQLGTPRFSRSIINSCTQFAYEHAQKIIDNPEEKFGVDDFPEIFNGWTVAEISSRIQVLNSLAHHLRAKRYEDGALSINNPKLRFTLDPITGEPESFSIEERQEANFLIEEFMLLANQSVARYIYERFPDKSILRNHAPPLTKSMKALRDRLANLGLDFDPSTSKSVYESMQRLCRQAEDPMAMDAVLNTLLTKPMARARYFCSEGKAEESDLWHYALSIPIYTHFTSPIRRYPDILVHRLLAAALNYSPPPQRTTDELHHLAKVCNEQKYNAKNAGDDSINLFFKRYVKVKHSLTLRAVVVEVFQHLVNVVIIETGHNICIHYKMQKVIVDTTHAPSFILISEKNSKRPPLKLQLFTTVDIKLVIWDDKLCGFFVSPDPKQRQLNSIESGKLKKQQELKIASIVDENNQQSSSSNVKRRRIKKNIKEPVDVLLPPTMDT